MEVIPADEFEPDKDPMRAAYRELREAEDIPVHLGFYVDDIKALETDYWERTGQNGAFVNLYGTEGLNDLQIHEIAPREQTSEVHFFYDQVVYVTNGHGNTTLGHGDDSVTFEWGPGSLFYVPLNTPFTHVNLSDSPARLVANTPLPSLVTMIPNPEFLLDPNIAEWSDQYDSEFYSGEGEDGTFFSGKYEGDVGPASWVTNFIPDISKFDKQETWDKLGAGNAVFIQFPNSGMLAHITTFKPGQYKKAHRHKPGAHLLIRDGEGYSLLWREEWDHKLRVDWTEDSVFVPPGYWFHHHFNMTDQELRHLALHPPRTGTLEKYGVFDAFTPENVIDYPDEDPGIRELYQAELGPAGLSFDMPPECFTDPDFSFG